MAVFERRTRGRPLADEATKRKRHVSVACTDAEYTMWEQAAAARKVSISEFMRQAALGLVQGTG